MSAALVELKGICKSFREGERERTVFHDASLVVAPGEWVFLLGRSGSGTCRTEAMWWSMTGR